MYLVVGLGNPGRDYAKTRHNVGFMTVDMLSERTGTAFTRSGFRAVYGEGRINGEKLIIAKPETYMNDSGFAVVDLINWFKIPNDHLIVIYDDIDLPCGAIRIRESGSAGTHNGMRSIVEQLGHEDFIRIRIGIGKPKRDLIGYVLGVPDADDMKLLTKAFSDAADAAILIMEGKLEEAQSKFNYKPPKKPKPEGGGEKPKKKDVYAPLLCLNGCAAERELRQAHEVFFLNTDTAEGTLFHSGKLSRTFPYGINDILDAEKRLIRFAPFIAKVFPETVNGIIESPLADAERLRRSLPNDRRPNKLFIKQDSELPIAGSVKARGGIYEVLKHTEELALSAGLLAVGGNGEPVGYEELSEHRDFFSQYSIQVGSTGNLGLSIGIMSAAIGYDVTVHMSSDAKTWKKELLRSKGCKVVEYETDYSKAVENGRRAAESDPHSYFVDDERSIDLFMGYAVAALRLKAQLDNANVIVDSEHPLFVHLPCGVGGAPGGITFGLKAVFGDAVHCFFIEPVNAPCMLAAFSTGKCVPVTELGLSGKTEADGLAVGCASSLVYEAMKPLMDGEFTVDDRRLIPYQKLINATEGIFVEPSAAASFAGAVGLSGDCGSDYLSQYFPGIPYDSITEILWATGGRLVPAEERFKRN